MSKAKKKTKKRVKPLKPLVVPIESQEHLNKIVDEIEEALSEPDPDPDDGRMTRREVIEWFRKDPHEEIFISLDKAGTAVACGDVYVQFKDGELRTSDPKVVEVLLNANAPGAKYGTHFVGLNPKFRNIK
jgi:hypothetical protein